VPEVRRPDGTSPRMSDLRGVPRPARRCGRRRRLNGRDPGRRTYTPARASRNPLRSLAVSRPLRPLARSPARAGGARPRGFCARKAAISWSELSCKSAGACIC